MPTGRLEAFFPKQSKSRCAEVDLLLFYLFDRHGTSAETERGLRFTRS